MKTEKMFYYDIILRSQEENHEGEKLNNDKKVINFIMKRLLDEYGWLVARVGLEKAATEWVQGLAIDVPYMNGDILTLAHQAGLIGPVSHYGDFTNEEITFLDSYWDNLGKYIVELFNLHNN